MKPDKLDNVHSPHGAEERFRLFVEQVVDYALFLLDPQGHITTWNAGAARIKGYSADEIVGQHFSKFYLPEDVWKCEVQLDTAQRTGRSEQEGWRVRKDGSLFWANVVITALHDDGGNLIGFAKVTRDLTEKRSAEQALRDSEERYRLLLESVKDYAIFLLDRSGRVQTWNVGAERINGYSAQEIIGRHVSTFHIPEDIATGKCDLELETARREGRFQDEGWRVRKDGTRFWASVITTALRDADGEIVGFTKITQDLSERRAAEQARVRLAEESARRDAAERTATLLTRLLTLSGQLGAAPTAREIAELIVREGSLALRAIGGVFFQNRDRLEPLATYSAESVAGADWYDVQHHQQSLQRAIQTGAPEWRSSTSQPGNVLYLPLVVAPAVLGVVAFRFAAPHELGPEERRLAEMMVAQTAQALDRAYGYERQVAMRHRVELLGELAEALSAALTVEDVARIVVDRGMQAARADTCTLYTLNEDAGTLDLIAEQGCNPQVLQHIRRLTPDSGNRSLDTVFTGEFVWVENPEQYAELYPQLARVPAEGQRARAFWSAPLRAEGRSIGLLGMGMWEPRQFSAEEREFIRTFTRYCAEALLRARRLEAERAAKALAERLKGWLETTLRSIGDAVITTDRAGAITMMNPEAERLTGWSEGEARGRPLAEVFEIVHETTRAVVQSPVDKVLEYGSVVGLANHTLLIGKDGREIAIDDSAAPIRGEDASTEGVVLVFRDVTDKKLEESRRTTLMDATATLAESLNFETTLSKVARLAVPRWADWCAVDLLDPDSDGRPRRLAVAHVDADKVRYAEELHDKYPPKADAPSGLMNVLRTGRSELYPEITDELLVATTQDGEHLRIARELGLRSAMVVPLIARDRVVGAMSFVFAESGRRYDESDLRFAEELARRCAIAIDNARLYASEQQARKAADVASRAKDEFLAVVSHELRTPLNAIMGWTKLMTLAGADDSRRERALETIERNAFAMAQLIEDLLDMSRIISGKMRLDMQRVDLARVIEGALDSIKPAADAKNIVTNAALEHGVPALLGDPTRLQQIVWNLVSNAVKFTPSGGHIDVTLVSDAKAVEIVVRDTGSGIAPKFLPHVFDAFRQQDASYSRSRGGLGLGLTITRQLVELHGGRIEAHSDGEGLGACFRVTLPLLPNVRVGALERRQRQESALRETAYERPTQLRDVKVLVVDDEPDARQLVQVVLEDCGCRVVLAASVDEALAAMSNDVPDLLISDIGMPERDGYELIHQVRALPQERGGAIPAAALTAYARAEDRRRLLSAGYSMHVPKPVEPAELVAVVASLTRFMTRAQS